MSEQESIEVAQRDAELAELDRILEEEDPEFTQGLEEVRGVEVPEGDLQIESFDIDSSLSGEDDTETEVGSGQQRLLRSLQAWLERRRLKLKNFCTAMALQVRSGLFQLPSHLKALALAIIGFLGQGLSYLSGAWSKWETKQRLAFLAFVLVGGVTVTMVLANLKGIWLPQLKEEVVWSLANHADQEFLVKKPLSENQSESDEDWISFQHAFPQPEHKFLLKKMVVNLRSSSGHPNPMGAFEIYLELDSRLAAVEVSRRESEVLDRVQRVLEGLTYSELDSPLGKNRAKELIRHDLDDLLTQGWVLDVHYKNVILKP